MMESYIYSLLRMGFHQTTRDKIKKMLYKLKQKNKPLLQFLHGTFNASDLLANLENKIGNSYDFLMIHCSMNELQLAYKGNVNELLNCFIDFCKSNGITLVMPAFFLGKSGLDLVAYYEENPLFSAKKTVSQMGLLSECLRRKKDTRRSLHPSHSICALGTRAKELVENHHLCDTHFGKGTPFEIMSNNSTAIVGIGVKYFRVLTQIHTAEDLCGNQFPIQLYERTIPVTLLNENNTSFNYNLKVWKKGIAERRRVHRLKKMVTKRDLFEWKFHGVPIFFANAHNITTTLYNNALKGKTIYSD